MLSSSSPARRTSMPGLAPVVRRPVGGDRRVSGGRCGGVSGTDEGAGAVSRAGIPATRSVVSARAFVRTAFPPPRSASAAPAPPSTTTAPATIGANRRLRSEEHTSELQSPYDIVCSLLLEKKKKK